MVKTDKSGRIEFLEEPHIYLLDGIKELPSVTTLMKNLPQFASKYDNVPKEILNAKATFGTNVHFAVECDGKGEPIPVLSPLEQMCYEQYLKVKSKYNICPIENEMIIHYKDIYAGTLDGIMDVNYTRSLVDVKTTATLDKEYLEWQLGFYNLALKDMGYETPITEFYALHLPKKDIGKLIKITPKSDKELLKALKGMGYEN